MTRCIEMFIAPSRRIFKFAALAGVRKKVSFYCWGVQAPVIDHQAVNVLIGPYKNEKRIIFGIFLWKFV